MADSYNLANNTPNMIFDLVLGGVLSATLVPVFVERLTTRDDEEASRAVSAVLTLAGAVLTAASLATVAGAPWIIRLYNALNRDTILAQADAFAIWQRAQLNMQARFFKFSGQFDF